MGDIESKNNKNQKIATLLNQKEQLLNVKKKRDSIYKRKLKNLKTELKILKYKGFLKNMKKKKKSKFSWKPAKQDYEYLKVNRCQLLPYLNKEVKITGIIKKFSNGHLLHKQEPKACLIDVKIGEAELTHLWIETPELNLFLKNDFIQLIGIIDFYFKKQEHPKFLSFGISKVQNLELIQ
jgi:hypothetical protein